ncbi:MAG: hypothetical protein P8Z30_03670 [Acidobacteriota bacterium]|jgi:hypothetical protein
MRRLVVLSLASCLAVSVVAFAQGTYKIETTKGLPGGDVTPAVSSLLQPQGESLQDSAGKVLCEVWLRKNLTAATNPDTAGNVLYGKIAEGSLVGVIHFPENTKDYRGQSVKAGYYTLRYSLIPQNGNHMGVSQYRDFLLLVPAAKDPGGTAGISFDDCVKLSRGSTDTGHPGVMMMDPVSDSNTTFPAVFQDYTQDWALQEKAEVGSASLPLAIVLVGQYQGE